MPPKPRRKKVLFPCPKCNAPITMDDYISVPIPEQRFYHELVDISA